MMKIVLFFALVSIAAAGSVNYAYNTNPYVSYGGGPAIRGIGGPVHYSPYINQVAPFGYTAHGPIAYSAVAPAAPITYAAPALVKAVAPEPYDHHPQYNYGYSVQDATTGDSKSHTETRDGDKVTGQYSLVEPDGSLRVVTYTADAINGFNAIVDRQAPTLAVAKTVVAPIAAYAGYSAPAYALPQYSAYATPNNVRAFV